MYKIFTLALLILVVFALNTKAQIPNISYKTPQTVYLNKSLVPIKVTNKGGVVPNAVFPGVAKLIAVDAPVDRFLVLPSGDIYASASSAVIHVKPNGNYINVAGSGVSGYAEGLGNAAAFNDISAIVMDAAGNIYVTDMNARDGFNCRIRKITPAGLTSTFAAGFVSPNGLAIGADGTIYVSEGIGRITKLTKDGKKTLFAGGDTPGNVDGMGAGASFSEPRGICLDKAGNLFVADYGNNLIRKITPQGMVSTVAGSGKPGINGTGEDGKGRLASFYGPYEVHVDSKGGLVISESNDVIRKITPDGEVFTIKSPYLDEQGNPIPQGVTNKTAIDAQDNIIVYAGEGSPVLGFYKILTTGYSIYPALPPGLKLGSDGSISGTPSEISTKTRYNITASNGAGVSRAAIDLDVTLSKDVPVITSFNPVKNNRGQKMFIYGSYFTGTTGVSIGGKRAINFQVQSNGNTIEVYIPDDADSGEITVTTPYGVARITGFEIIPPPVITSISPRKGPQGTKVTITGTGFEKAYHVYFGEFDASYTIISPTQIEATIENGGTGKVEVVSPAGMGSFTGFTFIKPPAVTSTLPASAGVGSAIVIKGSNFSNATSVKFGAVAAKSFKVNSDTQITAVIAEGSSSTITITTPGGTSTYTGFTFVPVPVISQAAPLKGGVNTQVNIYGSGLKDAQVTIGGVPASVIYGNDYQIVVTVGVGASSGDIEITTAGGTAKLEGFVVVAPPTITSFSPQTAGVGDKITITGTGLADVNIVQFGGVYASFKIISPTVIEAIVGVGSSGAVKVSNPGGTAFLDGFTHKGPFIDSFTPTSALSGETVTINGSNFNKTTNVTFGGSPAKSFSIISATQIKAVVGTGKSGAVVVTTPLGSAYKEGFQHPGPSISLISPLYAGPLSNYPVIISGSNLTDVNSVTFGGVAATSFSVESSYNITVTPPVGVSGDVVVSSPKGSDKLAGFVWVQPPVISDFTPKTQNNSGSITVTGKNFIGVTNVTIGGAPCSFNVISPTSLSVYVGSARSGDIEVSTVGGKTKLSGFISPLPTISSISPNTAAVNQTVTIKGTNFVNVKSVKFGYVDASSFKVISDKEIQAVVAKDSGGPIMVTTADGTTFSNDFVLLLPPVIYSASPDKVGLGTLVTISGTNLSSTTNVDIGGVKATLMQVSDNSVQVKVSTGATGAIVLTTPAGTVTFGALVWYAAPVIVSADPIAANAETTVTIKGKNFDEITEVTFGNMPVGWTVVSPTEITVLPTNAASGDIKITGAGGIASLPGFTFIKAPQISSFAKTGDGTNATVTLTGLYFNKVTEVKFGGVNAKSFTVNSATSITAQPGTGATGIITVKAEGGTGSIRGYLYIVPPAITSLSAPYGAIGSTITINGDNFNIDAKKNVVFFGIFKATVISSTKNALQVTVPAGGSGIVTVTDIDKRLSARSNISFSVTNNLGPKINFSNKLDIAFNDPMGGAGAIEDLDEDGFADILAVQNDMLYVFLHGSDPQLSKSSFSKKVVLLTKRPVLSLITGDVDGDGKKDILIGSFPSVVLLRNTSTAGNISFEQKTLENIDGDDGLLLRDMDMDGRPDIVSNQNYRTYLNKTVGTNVSFANSVPLIDNSDGGSSSLLVSDFNGDGKPELINTSSNDVGQVYKNNSLPGSIDLTDFVESGINHASGFYNPNGMLITDIDNDGKTDMVGYSNRFKYLQVFRNVSNGQINGASFANTIALPINTIPSAMGTVDLDGDGRTDLIELLYSNLLFLRNLTAGGKIAFAPEVAITPESDKYITTVRSVDMDGDGRMDITFVTPEKSTLTIYHNGPVVKPVITAVTPLVASANSKITITGKHLDAASVVKFGTKKAKSFEVISHEKIEAIIGDGESGLVTVVTPNGTATFADFAFTKEPIINSAVATTDGGGVLIITGEELGTAKNVEIGGVKALSFKIDSETQITATFPPVNGSLSITTSIGTATFDNVTIKGTPVITFDPLNTLTYGNADVPLVATSTNTSTPLSYSFDKPGVVTVASGKLHIVNAGTVVITVTQAGNDLFNAPVSVAQKLVINKKDLSAKPDDQQRAYGKQNPILNIQYSGFVNGDDKTKLTSQPVASTMADPQSPAGIYDITVSAGVSENYNFIYSIGKLTVTPAASNLKVAGNSITCKGQNNGSITISASQSANYTALVTSAGFSKTINFTVNTSFENLQLGTYNVCVVDNALPAFKQCFDVIIAEPKDLSVYTSVSQENNSVLLSLSGGNSYDIKLNGIAYHTTDNQIDLPLNYGSNQLLVSTDKDCQGIIERIVNLSGNTAPYPNPFHDVLYINVGIKKVAKTIITIYDVANGQMVMRKEFINESGVLNLDVSGLKKSVYALHLTINNKRVIYKIFN